MVRAQNVVSTEYLAQYKIMRIQAKMIHISNAKKRYATCNKSTLFKASICAGKCNGFILRRLQYSTSNIREFPI